MNIVEALNVGKVVFFKSMETRYYKKENGKYFYSDNLKDWIKSHIKEDAFLDATRWAIHN